MVFVLILGMNFISATSKIIQEETTLAVSSTDDDIDWWPMFHHDLNHTGHSTSTGPETNDVRWSFQAEGGIRDSSPAIVDNKVFFGCTNINFYCLNSNTGEKIWHILIPGMGVTSPAVDNGKVYFGTSWQNKGIYCLNSTNGEIIWRYQTNGSDSILASPAIYEGKVFIGAPNPEPGCIYCLDADTGEEIWISQSIDNPRSAAIYNGMVFFGAEDFNIYCIDAGNGTIIWKYKTGGVATPYIDVTIYDDKLFAGGRDGLYCLDLYNGSLVWKYPTDDYIYTTPCTANGNVYFAADDGYVYCLNATSGEKIWDFMTNSYFLRSSPAYADGKIYISSEGFNSKIYCLNATSGEKIWDFNTVSIVWCSPSIANGNIYIGFELGEFLCFGGESNNKSPITPKEIFGPTSGKLGIEYTYNTSTYDPDGDQLYYLWNSVQGITDWIGPVESNETVEFKVTFHEYSTHIIEVIVKDSNHARSDWAKLEVRVARDKTITNSFLLRIFNRYPLLERILNLIIN